MNGRSRVKIPQGKKKVVEHIFVWRKSIKGAPAKSEGKLCCSVKLLNYQPKNHRESSFLFCTDPSWFALGCPLLSLLLSKSAPCCSLSTRCQNRHFHSFSLCMQCKWKHVHGRKEFVTSKMIQHSYSGLNIIWNNCTRLLMAVEQTAEICIKGYPTYLLTKFPHVVLISLVACCILVLKHHNQDKKGVRSCADLKWRTAGKRIGSQGWSKWKDFRNQLSCQSVIQSFAVLKSLVMLFLHKILSNISL